MPYDLPQLEKRPADSRLYDLEFDALLTQAGDTISSVTSFVVTPTTLSPLTFGTPVASGTRVQVRLSGGLSGVTYKITCVVASAGSDAVEGECNLLVLDT